MLEFHRVRGTALRGRAQRGRVAKHFRQGHFRADGLAAAARRLELSAKNGDAAGVKRDVPQLLAELGNLAGVLRRARKTA